LIFLKKKIVFPEKKNESQDNKKKSKNNSVEEEKKPGEFVPLYIINSAARDDSQADGVKIVSIKITLTFYRPGTFKLPEIIIKGSDGISIAYNIPDVTIEEINKDGKLEEIEPPISLAGNYARIIWIIAIVLLIAAVASALFYYFRKRKKIVVPETAPIPPIELFLNEVESLKLTELIEAGKINEYVFAISIIFRRYISAMLMFDAAEMTTDEISSKIKKFMPEDLYFVYGEEIISNMRLWDFSKFAEFTPSRELLLQNLDATISVAKKISGTQLVPEVKDTQENVRGGNGTARI